MGTKEEIAEVDRTVCNSAEKFSNLFYQAMEKRRDDVHAMYTEEACFVWNGHALTGRQLIHEFLTNLPSATFTVRAVDAQGINSKLTDGKNSMLVTCSGQVRMEDRQRGFTQTFILAEGDGKWRIISDRFRFAT